MPLKVINPGLFSTVQDLGRTGFRSRGVPTAGVFDSKSASLANALLANPPNCAMIELTLRGGVYEAQSPLALALAGASMEARISRPNAPERLLQIPQSFSLQTGDRLVLGAVQKGARTYLATLDGWQTPLVLGSRSSETPLRPGDILPSRQGFILPKRPHDQPELMESEITLRVLDGPDADPLSTAWLDQNPTYHVGPKSNRIGLRLKGATWPVEPDPDRFSTPLSPGAIQVAGGLPLLLGVACGTMGGYPHVAQVISADRDRIAQARPGDLLRLVRVTLDEARRLDALSRREHYLRLLRVAAACADNLQDEPS